MQPRPQKVLTPETIFDKTVLMAIERGRLADMIFDDPERLSHRALGRIIHAIEHSPPFKATLAIAPLRSLFLSGAVGTARLLTGRIGSQFS
jgi:hypothetical protein